MTVEPQDLGARGGAFWSATLDRFNLSDSELELLMEACRLLDEVDDLHAAIARDGVTVAGSAGQPRVNPALGEVRQHRLALGRILSQLAIPDPDGKALVTPYQARGKRGAEARWASHRTVGA